MGIGKIIILSAIIVTTRTLVNGIQHDKIQNANFVLSDKIEKLSKKEIRERFNKIVAHVLMVKISEINDSKKFVTDLGADSLDTIELIVESEKEFKISIPGEVAEKAETVGQFIDMIYGIVNNIEN